MMNEDLHIGDAWWANVDGGTTLTAVTITDVTPMTVAISWKEQPEGWVREERYELERGYVRFVEKIPAHPLHNRLTELFTATS